MLRLQPSELTLTQSEVQQWTKQFNARKIARTAAAEFARTHAHHATARVRRGPERSRDDAIVVIPEGYLPSPSTGSTESGEHYETSTGSPTDDSANFKEAKCSNVDEHEQSHSSSSEDNFSLEDLPCGFNSMSIEDSFDNNEETVRRRFRPRSWSDPGGSADIPRLFVSPSRVNHPRRRDDHQSAVLPHVRSSTTSGIGASGANGPQNAAPRGFPWIDGFVDPRNSRGQNQVFSRQVVVTRGGRPRMEVLPQPRIRMSHRVARRSDENSDEDLETQEAERRLWLSRANNMNGIIESTPPRSGRLEAIIQRQQLHTNDDPYRL